MTGLLVAAGGAAWEGTALARIAVNRDLTLVRRCVDVADLLAATVTHPADCVLVDAQLEGLDLDVVRRLDERGLVVCSVAAEARHLGIEHSIQVSDLDELASKLVAAAEHDQHSFAEEIDSGGGTVIAVWGPTGAPGRTTVATSLAAVFAAGGVRTVLVDADTRGGAVAQMLAILDDVSGLMAACREANLGATHDVARHLVDVGDGLHVLTGLPRADMWQHVRPAALERVIRALAENYEMVIVDCGFGIEDEAPPVPARDQATRTVLAVADEVVLVGRADPIGLARLLRAHDEARPWTRDPVIVVNGMRPSLGWTENQIGDTIVKVAGLRPCVTLPLDHDAVDKAVLTGRAVPESAPTSGVATGIGHLARRLRLVSGVEVPATK